MYRVETLDLVVRNKKKFIIISDNGDVVKIHGRVTVYHSEKQANDIAEILNSKK